MFNAGAVIGQLKLDIRDWTGNVNRGIKDTRILRKGLKESENQANQLGKTMNLLAAGGLALAAKQMITLSMDAEETANLFRVSMGSMADSAQEFIDQTRAVFPIAEYTMQDMVGKSALLASSMGFAEDAAADFAKAVVNLSMDMSSLRNKPFLEANERLLSALVGNTEALRGMGVAMTIEEAKREAVRQGIIKENRELNEQEKLMAILAVVIRKTAADRGDLLRTINSTANQTKFLNEEFKQLRKEMGDRLKPAYASTVVILRAVVQQTTKFIKENEFLVNSLVNVTTGILAAVGVMHVMRIAVAALKVEIISAKIAALGAWNAVALAIAGVAAAFVALKTEAETNLIGIGKYIKGFFDGVANAFTAVVRDIKTLLNTLWVETEKLFFNMGTVADAFNSVWTDTFMMPSLFGNNGSVEQQFRDIFGKIEGISLDALDTITWHYKEGFDALWDILSPSKEDLDLMSWDEIYDLYYGKYKNMLGITDAGDEALIPPGVDLSIDKIKEMLSKLTGDFSIADDKVKKFTETFIKFREEANRVYNGLYPVREVFQGLQEDINTLAMGGMLDADALGILGANAFDAIKDEGLPAIKELRKEMEGLSQAAQQGFNEAMGKWMIQNLSGAARKTKEAKEETQSWADQLDNILSAGQGLARSGRNWLENTKAIVNVFKSMKRIIDIVRKAQKLAEIASGNWMAILTEVVAMAAEAMGLFGRETEKVKTGVSKMFDELKKATQEWGEQLTDVIVEFVKTGKFEFKDFVNSVMEDMIRIAIQTTLIEPAISGLGGLFKSTDGGLQPAYSTSVGSIPDSIARQPMGVTVIDQRVSGADIQVSQGKDADGREQMMILVQDAVTENIAKGRLDRSFRTNYGVIRRPKVR